MKVDLIPGLKRLVEVGGGSSASYKLGDIL